MEYQGLDFIKNLIWEEVFDIWEKNEASDPSWIKHAQTRGFKTWREWRETMVPALNLDRLEWSLYQIKNPNQIVPLFHSGPFKAWSMFYNGKSSVLFKDLIQQKSVQSNNRLQKMISNFPTESSIIGVNTRSNNIVIIEGMHRCLALSYCAGKKEPLNADLKIALADYPKDRLPLLGTSRKISN